MNKFKSLNQQYIGGEWKNGSSLKKLTDVNPYNGETITEFQLASITDIDEVYQAAAKAKLAWDQVNAYQKRTILEQAITYIEQNEADIVDLIIQELGETRKGDLNHD